MLNITSALILSNPCFWAKSIACKASLKFAEFKNKFNRDFEETYKAQIEKLLKDNLIYLDDEGIRLTHRGMDISNYVFASFM
jgi:coproporphyrinogen III oxidase-like Fe-S oxidoreductase